MSIGINWNRVSKLVGNTLAPTIRDNNFSGSVLFVRYVHARVLCHRHGIGPEMIPNWDTRWRPTEARRLWKNP